MIDIEALHKRIEELELQNNLLLQEKKDDDNHSGRFDSIYYSSSRRDQISVAMAKARLQFDPIEKNRKGARGKYADLQSIIPAVAHQLEKNGLHIDQHEWYNQETKESFLISVVYHAPSNQWIKAITPLLYDRKDMQSHGSASTYAKRYHYRTLLGLYDDEDDDGESIRAPEPSIKKSSTINEKQLALLQAKLAIAPELKQEILTRCKITSLDQIPWTTFNPIIKFIDDKIEEKKKE